MTIELQSVAIDAHLVAMNGNRRGFDGAPIATLKSIGDLTGLQSKGTESQIGTAEIL